MTVLRTPDERFARLPGYPFPPSYAQVESNGIPALRMHYVDAGPPDGPVVVLLHGQPTWSYLYRDVISVLVDAGLRIIAPTSSDSAAQTSRPNGPIIRSPATSTGFIPDTAFGLE